MEDPHVKEGSYILAFLFFFKFFFFLMWTILKVFTEFVTILLVLWYGFLAAKHEGSYLPDQGSNPHPLH